MLAHPLPPNIEHKSPPENGPFPWPWNFTVPKRLITLATARLVVHTLKVNPIAGVALGLTTNPPLGFARHFTGWPLFIYRYPLVSPCRFSSTPRESRKSQHLVKFLRMSLRTMFLGAPGTALVIHLISMLPPPYPTPPRVTLLWPCLK